MHCIALHCLTLRVSGEWKTAAASKTSKTLFTAVWKENTHTRFGRIGDFFYSIGRVIDFFYCVGSERLLLRFWVLLSKDLRVFPSVKKGKKKGKNALLELSVNISEKPKILTRVGRVGNFFYCVGRIGDFFYRVSRVGRLGDFFFCVLGSSFCGPASVSFCEDVFHRI